MSPAEIELRHYPYPYQAMLSICSDLDGTCDRCVYERIARFCNTNGDTSMGPGVGLEVGNSIYFDMPPGEFAYWNTDEKGRAMVRAMIRSGHIDCLHSYGDLADSRAHAGRALDELARHDCALEVWVDHGTAPTNFDHQIMSGSGDQVGHRAYHADITLGHGIRYVWRGRVTSVTGQDTQENLGGLWSVRHPMTSGRTVAKEAAKHWLAKIGSRKYAMHGLNRVIRKATLRDGRPVVEFMRCNPHYGGVSSGETGLRLGEVLTDGVLKRLIRREGTCVLYTHLGKIRDPLRPFNDAAVGGLRRLAAAADTGDILVATTRRVLGYLEMRSVATLGSRCDRERIEVQVDTDPNASQCPAGLTVYVPDGARPQLCVNGEPVDNVRHNPPDHSGRPSVSVAWTGLEFPTW